MFDSGSCYKKDGTPKKSYESEREADEAAAYVQSAYGDVQGKYKCPKCGFWHLSPIERQTQCYLSSCLDSSGKQKQAYTTRKSAETRANIILQERGTKLYVYHCERCGAYHLTHTCRQSIR